MLLGGLAAACSAECDLAEGEQVRIARVMDGDALALDTGLKVRLAEVEAPAPGHGRRKDEPFAEAARALLNAAALGRSAKLWYGGLSRDSYDRALAHVIAQDEVGGGIWLNGYAARQGAARVRTYPDNAKRARRQLAMEQEARAAGRGPWADEHWRMRGLDDLEGAPYFVIVEGEVVALGKMAGDGEAHLTRGGIRFDVGDRIGAADVALTAGVHVRVRGRIDARAIASGGEPKMRVAHWAQVEVV